MKQVSIALLLAITIFSCQNTGDKNQSDVKVRETDSAIKENQPNDAAGSSGRNDTAMTPNKSTDPSAATQAPATNTGKDSIGTGSGRGQVSDSLKANKNKGKSKDSAR